MHIQSVLAHNFDTPAGHAATRIMLSFQVSSRATEISRSMPARGIVRGARRWCRPRGRSVHHRGEGAAQGAVRAGDPGRQTSQDEEGAERRGSSSAHHAEDEERGEDDADRVCPPGCRGRTRATGGRGRVDVARTSRPGATRQAAPSGGGAQGGCARVGHVGGALEAGEVREARGPWVAEETWAGVRSTVRPRVRGVA